ncbi:class I SAM-dependent methyltransferase [Synechococcus sp. MU1651]|uniref:class I SAM-dependent methyltransferase n=1 Tax=Synechococcus sp. MU1651 TaxID=2508353 RepID=UPI002025B808|nr:class I SAM-dependent methyltransferase [Synechococcus sp. MU1651]
MKSDLTLYEKNQSFNLINSYLHSFRYKVLLKLARSLSDESSEPLKVLDIGSGTSRCYDILKKSGFVVDYHAVEIDSTLSDVALRSFGGNPDFSLHVESVESWIGKFDGFDLIVAHESFEHIPPLVVSRVIDSLGKSRFGCLLVTVPVEIGPSILIKNIGSFLMGYSRYKEYRWHETLSASLYRLDNVDRHVLGHKGFDWRWLSQTLRLNLKIIKTLKSPFQFIPSFVSPSIGFVCVPDSSLIRKI